MEEQDDFFPHDEQAIRDQIDDQNVNHALMERLDALPVDIVYRAQMADRTRPTSHAATAQPAPVKKPTQNQTPIR
jgi:hypothetical protein